MKYIPCFCQQHLAGVGVDVMIFSMHTHTHTRKMLWSDHVHCLYLDENNYIFTYIFQVVPK
jgi:hypothetical protein